MNRYRWGGTAALLGAVLCLVLTPVQSSVWNGAGTPPLVASLRPLTDLAGRLHDASGRGISPYHFFGRLFCLVYLAAMAGLVALHGRQEGDAGRGEWLWFRVMLGGMTTALAGDVVAYWLGDPGEIGFLVESVALVVLLVAATVYGRLTLRAGAVPRWTAWALTVAGLAAVPSVLLTRYLPHGAVLPLSLALGAIGLALLRPVPRPAVRSRITVSPVEGSPVGGR